MKVHLVLTIETAGMTGRDFERFKDEVRTAATVHATRCGGVLITAKTYEPAGSKRRTTKR